jgi:hypothetical protein
MPLPAVIHCTSPRAEAAAIAEAVAVFDVAREHVVIVSMPRCGCHGKPAR